MQSWWYAKDGQRQGPITEVQIRDLIASGYVASSDLVWTQGMPRWVTAGESELQPKSAKDSQSPVAQTAVASSNPVLRPPSARVVGSFRPAARPAQMPAQPAAAAVAAHSPAPAGARPAISTVTLAPSIAACPHCQAHNPVGVAFCES